MYRIFFISIIELFKIGEGTIDLIIFLRYLENEINKFFGDDNGMIRELKNLTSHPTKTSFYFDGTW